MASSQFKLLLGGLLLLFNAGSTVFNQMALSENGGKMTWSPAISAATTEAFKLGVAGAFLAHSLFKAYKNKAPVVNMPMDFKFCIRYAVPGLLYAACNILMYTAVDYLGSTNFQLLNNIKIITTAVVYRIFLKRELKLYQWLALILLFFAMCTLGVRSNGCEHSVLPNSPASKGTLLPTGVQGKGDSVMKSHVAPAHNFMAGSLLMLLISFMSAGAGVYNEILVKGTKASVWWQNVLLYTYTFSICLASNSIFFQRQRGTDGGEIGIAKGLFAGFSYPLWICILMKAFYGQVVSLVFKYADNILKVYSSSLAVVASAVMCHVFIGAPLAFVHFISSGLIILATVLYYTDLSVLGKVDTELILGSKGVDRLSNL